MTFRCLLIPRITRYAELDFHGFLNDDCDVLVIFGLKPLLAFIVHFGCVKGDN
jgi:hypothetical protein